MSGKERVLGITCELLGTFLTDSVLASLMASQLLCANVQDAVYASETSRDILLVNTFIAALV